MGAGTAHAANLITKLTIFAIASSRDGQMQLLLSSPGDWHL